MKTFKNCGLALAIAAALVMTTTSCSSENDLVETPNVEQPTQPTTDGVKITVSAGIGDDGTTRSEVGRNDAGNRVLKFTEGDRLYVYGFVPFPVKGMLTMVENSLSPDGKSASFTGSLLIKNGSSWSNYNSGDKDPLEGTTATLIHKDMVEGTDYWFYGYDELVIKCNPAPDVETLMTKNLTVTGDYDSSTKSFTLSGNDAIFNCIITGLDVSTYYHCQLRYSSGGSYTYSSDYSFYFTTDADGTAHFAFDIDRYSEQAWEIEIKKGDDLVGTIPLGTQTLEKKIYNVSRYWTGTEFSKTIDLSTISHDLLVGSGMTLTGTLSGNYKISIAAGATVTLSGATIPGRVADDHSTPWAGITCLGDATIVLADGSVNSVKGYDDRYPGIQAGPAGTTLTIRGGSAGTGKLTAHTGMDTSNGFGAGIGGGCDMAVGNIRIEGGDITATASFYGAGIGSGWAHELYGWAHELYAWCDGITITGGTVKATGGYDGAGIGGGRGTNQYFFSGCDNITISGGTVYATGGDHAPGIGSGADYSSCGDINITGGSGTATGGMGSPCDIGKGVGNNASCGTVSVAPGTINAICACTFVVKYYASYTESNNMVNAVPVYNVNSTLKVTVNGKDYTTTSTYSDGETVTIDLPAVNGATVTVSTPNGTPYDSNQYTSTNPQPTATFSCTIENVTITEDGTNNLGTVNLIKQNAN